MSFGTSVIGYKRLNTVIPILLLPNNTSLQYHGQVELDQLCMHTCSILGQEGHFWPAPTFRIVASDRPDEQLDAKSPTGAWNAVLSRINSEIEAR